MAREKSYVTGLKRQAVSMYSRVIPAIKRLHLEQKYEQEETRSVDSLETTVVAHHVLWDIGPNQVLIGDEVEFHPIW